MALDETLAGRLRAALPAVPGLTEKKMFGGLSFLLHGHMLVGITGKGDLVFRFDPQDHEAALAEPHVREMDFTGRPMRGFVFVSEEGIAREEDLARWIGRSLSWVTRLPPKPAAPAKRRRR